MYSEVGGAWGGGWAGGGGGWEGSVDWPESRVGRMIARSGSPSVEPAKDGVPPAFALLRSLLRSEK